MNEKLNTKLTIRLYKEGKCFGPGIAELLERIQERRSLRAAAQSMNMAYSKAWTMVRSCETALGRKLLLYATGGKHGGGAELTDDAVRLLAAYRAYCAQVQSYADEQFPMLFSDFIEKE